MRSRLNRNSSASESAVWSLLIVITMVCEWKPTRVQPLSLNRRHPSEPVAFSTTVDRRPREPYFELTDGDFLQNHAKWQPANKSDFFLFVMIDNHICVLRVHLVVDASRREPAHVFWWNTKSSRVLSSRIESWQSLLEFLQLQLQHFISPLPVSFLIHSSWKESHSQAGSASTL